jgi:hypothetical protein
VALEGEDDAVKQRHWTEALHLTRLMVSSLQALRRSIHKAPHHERTNSVLQVDSIPQTMSWIQGKEGHGGAVATPGLHALHAESGLSSFSLADGRLAIPPSGK